MRFSYLLTFVLILVGAGAFWYQAGASICPVPLAYRLGNLDGHFNISKEKALTDLAKAEKVWEDYAERDLFYYDENADLVVDFVFDERQASADSETTQRELLDKEKEQNEATFTKIKELQAEYEVKTRDYQTDVSAYESRLQSYNEKVSRYNDQGGAPQDVYAELEKEKERLAKEAADLNDTATQLNELADKINELSEQANKLVETYNQKVQYYNTEFGYSREFTQGDYQDGQINVYKFSNDTELEKVLVHEFGHALGIDHVEGESSVMYYLLGDTSSAPTLSDDDKKAFVAVCGTGDEWQHKARRFIRNLLAAVNI